MNWIELVVVVVVVRRRFLVWLVLVVDGRRPGNSRGKQKNSGSRYDLRSPAKYGNFPAK
jgi:hypothetical protein